MRILYVNTPIYDYLTASLMEGLVALGHEVLTTETVGVGHKLTDAEIFPAAESSDVIVVGSNLGVRTHLMQGVKNPRKVFVDGSDFQDFEVTNNIRFKIVFKRELSRCNIDAEHQFIFPLPFAAEQRYFTKELPEKDLLVTFLATMRTNPWRGSIHQRLMNLRHPGVISGATNERAYDPNRPRATPTETPQYRQLLRRSRISVSVAGAGFDTARFWEILAAKAMLFTQELDIVIPQGFTDGVDYVVFRSLDEFDEKLAYYLDHLDQVREIAQRGHDRVCAHHTSAARAGQFLEIVDKFVTRDGFCELFLHPEIRALEGLCVGRGIDVGCGSSKTTPNCMGVDLTPAGMIGSVGFERGRISVADIATRGDDLALFPDGTLDFVVARHDLEYYQDPAKTLREWSRVLRTGGVIGVIVSDYKNVNTNQPDPTHYSHFTTESLQAVVESLGCLKIRKIEVCVPNWSLIGVFEKCEMGEREKSEPSWLENQETPEGAPVRATHCQIVTVEPDGNIHAKAFHEVAETLLYALQRMGVPAQIAVNQFDPDAVNIILGWHLLSEEAMANLPEQTVLYNLEQLDEQNKPMLTRLLTMSLRFEVWDYSRRNLEILREAGFQGTLNHAPVGFVDELCRIQKAPEQDIDVLFYGSVNERRLRILEALRLQGLKVEGVFGVYGTERDALIARAKVILNMHYYDSSIFEIVRVSYLLANRKAVVGECHPGTEIDPELHEAIRAVPYEGLVEACLDLVRNDGARAALEARGHGIFSAIREEAILGAILGGEPAPETTTPHALPRRLNIGSGKDWREDCLNVDYNDYWRPDAVLDLNLPLDHALALPTERFGPVRLEKGYFQEIIANNVLEHIPDLITAMRTCLDLLAEGGRFRIKVPYDLSHGAWQHPTHVRAFNEQSWLYYTDWFWYLGWSEARFELEELIYGPSPWGHELLAKGKPKEELIRQPRAINDMHVVLRKRRLTEHERTIVETYLTRPTHQGRII